MSVATLAAPAPIKSLELREYQQEAIAAIEAEFDKGNLDVLLMAATGAGKTIIGISCIDRWWKLGLRVLWLAHTTELVGKQPMEKITDFFPHLLPHCGVVMAGRDDADKAIVFATVQTLQSGDRLERVLDYGAFDIVIYDEAHHAVADRNKELLDCLREFNPQMRHLGMTATPIRADDKGLIAVYKSEANGDKKRLTLARMVKEGALVPPRWLAVQTAISVAGVSVVYGGGEKDFNQTKLANVFETDNCFELVVATHKQYTADRQALCFTVSVEGAHRLAEEFEKAGYVAKAVSGKTPKKERLEIIKAFERGEVQVICNVAVFSEGFDAPTVSVIHNVCPTMSDGYYLQKIGRGLRKVGWLPWKIDCVIFDYCPKETRNLVFLGSVLGIKMSGKSIENPEAEPGEILSGFTFDGRETKWLTGSAADLVTRQLNYLDASPLQWVGGKEAIMTLCIGADEKDIDRSLAITWPNRKPIQLWGIATYKVLDKQGNVVKRRSKDGLKEYDETNTICKLVMESDDYEAIGRRAEESVAKYGASVLVTKKKAQWRKQMVTEGQRKFGDLVKTALNAGEASDIIGRHKVLQVLARNNVITKADAEREAKRLR